MDLFTTIRQHPDFVWMPAFFSAAVSAVIFIIAMKGRAYARHSRAIPTVLFALSVAAMIASPLAVGPNVIQYALITLGVLLLAYVSVIYSGVVSQACMGLRHVMILLMVTTTLQGALVATMIFVLSIYHL